MKISLIIPSRNNLKYLKFAYNSIRKCLDSNYELVLLDDASTDDTWKWLNEIKKTDPNVIIYRNEGPDRVGHTVLYDKGVELSTTEVFGIFHADMIASPNYIKNLLKHLKEKTVVSATRIEPPLHPGGVEKIVKNFGTEPEEFDYDEFLNFVKETETNLVDKVTNGVFAPWLMYKKDFLSIGGHDKKVFAPMELEDSDLFNRFLLAGYNLIQSRDSFVYHMTCRGSRFKDGVKIESQIQLNDGTIWYKPKDSEEYTHLRNLKFREWWRKWHMDVLHDENLLPIVHDRYDIGFIIHNCSDQLLYVLEPWCDNIYINKTTSLENYIKSEQKYSKFNIRNKIKNLIDNKSNDVLLEFDGNNFTRDHINFIKTFSEILSNTNDVGEFEFDIFKIKISSFKKYNLDFIQSEGGEIGYYKKLLID